MELNAELCNACPIKHDSMFGPPAGGYPGGNLIYNTQPISNYWGLGMIK